MRDLLKVPKRRTYLELLVRLEVTFKNKRLLTPACLIRGVIETHCRDRSMYAPKTEQYSHYLRLLVRLLILLVVLQ